MDYLLKMQKDITEHPLTFLLLKEHKLNPSLSDTLLAIRVLNKYEDKFKDYPLENINNDFELFNKLSSEEREAFNDIMIRLQEQFIISGEYMLKKD